MVASPLRLPDLLNGILGEKRLPLPTARNLPLASRCLVAVPRALMWPGAGMVRAWCMPHIVCLGVGCQNSKTFCHVSEQKHDVL